MVVDRGELRESPVQPAEEVVHEGGVSVVQPPEVAVLNQEHEDGICVSLGKAT
jgi:hypothetical protein